MPIPPRDDLGHAANFLYMLDGRDHDSVHVRALDVAGNQPPARPALVSNQEATIGQEHVGHLFELHSAARGPKFLAPQSRAEARDTDFGTSAFR